MQAKCVDCVKDSGDLQGRADSHSIYINSFYLLHFMRLVNAYVHALPQSNDVKTYHNRETTAS